MLSRFRNDHVQNAILQICLDTVLIHQRRKREGTMKLSHGPLRNPIFWQLLMPFLMPFVMRNLTRLVCLASRFRRIVFSGGFVTGGRVGHFTSYAALSSLGTFRGIVALDTAFDDYCVRVGEADVNVFLLDAGELALELIGFLVFTNVELGREGANGVRISVLGTLCVDVVEKLEDGMGVAIREAWKERHDSFV